MSEEDLRAYFARIFYAGPRDPTLAVLGAIVAAHAQAIPFENCDVLLGRPIELDTGALMAKLVHGRRGGYCFEHNALLMRVLETLGFAVDGLAARVVWGRTEDARPPRTHMLLRVALDEGDHLADVGFGGLTLTAPLALASLGEQETPHEPHRLVALDAERDGELALEVRLGEPWTRLYEFSLQRQWPIDYELANWFTATHPGSLFTNNLLAARPDPDRRYGLLNDALTIRHRDGRVEHRRFEGPRELGEALSRYFTIALSADEVERVAAAIAGPRG